MLIKKLFFSGSLRKQRSFSTSLQIEEGKVALDDKTFVKYVRTGTGSKTLLLLPGALGTAKSDFGPQLKGLNKEGHLSIVSWDPPGYGESRPPERKWPQTPNFFYRDADACTRMMSALGYERFSVLGWSDGGITSLIVAALYPDKIEKLICYAGNAYISDQDVSMLEKVTDVSKWSEKMKEPMEGIYGKEYFPVLWSEWVSAYQGIASSNKGNICRDLLSKIVCPSLIIQGEKDPMVSKEHPEYLLKHISNSRLKLYADGKHNLHLKFHEEFNRLVEKFVIE